MNFFLKFLQPSALRDSKVKQKITDFSDTLKNHHVKKNRIEDGGCKNIPERYLSNF